ncbi:signal peptidase 22kDa subunit [Catenaria anguillulae PL171]|uniref:Signal peptidase subunit 3 n=1 Tax=Catenaria anguillulae PL171 TaxID=765915 RepID=A0A1Y2HLR4_9FUNG|nr:signal peptidase 22kDa subunit [Catenaria anguillulae PL171]
MHSITSRASAVASYATSALIALAAVIAAASLFNPLVVDPSASPDLRLGIQSVALLPASRDAHYHWQSYYHQPRHYGLVHFNLTADLAPLFTWNVKQVHAMLTLSYGAPGGKDDPITHNKMTIWDAILPDREDARIVLANQPNPYGIVDLRHGRVRRLEGVEATLRLEYCVHTMLGAIRCTGDKHKVGDATVVTFKFPKLGDAGLVYREGEGLVKAEFENQE